MDTSNINQLLRIQDASELTTIGKSTIRLWIAQGKFPEPITLSPTIKVWRIEQILNWIEQQKANSEKPSHLASNIDQPKSIDKVALPNLEKIQ
jgi:prophage regulatory protein